MMHGRDMIIASVGLIRHMGAKRRPGRIPPEPKPYMWMGGASGGGEDLLTPEIKNAMIGYGIPSEADGAAETVLTKSSTSTRPGSVRYQCVFVPVTPGKTYDITWDASVTYNHICTGSASKAGDDAQIFSVAVTFTSGASHVLVTPSTAYICISVNSNEPYMAGTGSEWDKIHVHAA